MTQLGHLRQRIADDYLAPEAAMVRRYARAIKPDTAEQHAVMQEAAQTCDAQDKAVEVTEETRSSQAFIPGNFPRVELTFRCE